MFLTSIQPPFQPAISSSALTACGLGVLEEEQEYIGGEGLGAATIHAGMTFQCGALRSPMFLPVTPCPLLCKET